MCRTAFSGRRNASLSGQHQEGRPAEISRIVQRIQPRSPNVGTALQGKQGQVRQDGGSGAGFADSIGQEDTSTTRKRVVVG